MKVEGRQARARNRWLLVTALCGLLALGAGGEQVAVNGWSAFVFRGPGIGATASGQEPATTTAAASPSPTADVDPTKDVPPSEALPALPVLPVLPALPVLPVLPAFNRPAPAAQRHPRGAVNAQRHPRERAAGPQGRPFAPPAPPAPPPPPPPPPP